jgi:pyruvate,water dikinase
MRPARPARVGRVRARATDYPDAVEPDNGATGRDITWPPDCGPSARWPIYTRGNVGEVYPDVVLPLEWELGGPASERGWQQGAAEIGFITEADTGDEPYVIIGIFGGYAYFNVSVMRLLGVRTPGMGPELIDTQFLGEADIAPYSPRPGDRNLRATARVVTTALKTLGAKSVPLLDEMERKADAHRAAAPPLDASDEQLWSYLKDGLDELWGYFIGSHVIVTMKATIAAGNLADLCEKHLGDPNRALDLTTGIGDVVSAEPAKAMWRLANDTTESEFEPAFARFIERYGHRGPNEFSLAGRDWASFPDLALAAIDTMRGVDPDRAPEVQAKRMAERRADAMAEARAKMGWRARLLDRAVRSATLWSRAREQSKNQVIRANQKPRHAFLELVRRAEERGGVSDRLGPLLLTEAEFLTYVDDPASMIETIERRRVDYEHLRSLEPPFAFDTSTDGVPPTSTWARRPQADADSPTSGPQPEAAGTTLTGAAGAPGVARGKARVVVDPADPRGLEPGDVLVAPLTDPSWTPLFVGAAAVVVEIGAAMSHSMIVSRELGIPCVVGVDDATLRIADGAEVEVDGSTGTVTVL